MSTPIIPISCDVQIPLSATEPVVADFSVGALRVAYVHQRDIKQLPANEWSVPCIYVLLTDDGSHQVYIGKANDARARLLRHRSEPKLAWTRAVVIKRDTTDGFNSAKVGYLEGCVAAEVRAIPDVTVVEGKHDQDKTLPLREQQSLDGFLPSILAALRLAGMDMHKKTDKPKPKAKETSQKQKTSTRRNKEFSGIIAAGYLHANDKLYLKTNAQIIEGTVTSLGTIRVADKEENSPSGAAKAALGGMAADGWNRWYVGDIHGPKLAVLRNEWRKMNRSE